MSMKVAFTSCAWCCYILASDTGKTFSSPSPFIPTDRLFFVSFPDTTAGYRREGRFVLCADSVFKNASAPFRSLPMPFRAFGCVIAVSLQVTSSH